MTRATIIDFKTSQSCVPTAIRGKMGAGRAEQGRLAAHTTAGDRFMQICNSCTKFRAGTCLCIELECGHGLLQGRNAAERSREPAAAAARRIAAELELLSER